jgi:phage gpG-like protein
MPDSLIVIEDAGDWQALLARLSADFRQISYVDPLTAFLDRIAERNRVYFEHAHAPGGESWAELSPVTVSRKGHDTILVETGKLRDSLTGGNADSIREVLEEGQTTTLIFGSQDRTVGFHQYGTRRMPARPPVGLSEGALDNLCDVVADTAVAGLMEDAANAQP